MLNTAEGAEYKSSPIKTLAEPSVLLEFSLKS